MEWSWPGSCDSKPWEQWSASGSHVRFLTDPVSEDWLTGLTGNALAIVGAAAAMHSSSA